MKDLFRSRSAFSPISRFGIYSRLPDARAFLLLPGFIISRVAGIYLARTEARVRSMICGAFGRSGYVKRRDIAKISS